jgi:hypothetical protein
MALPARKIYDDDTESGANSRPKFGVIDGGGESTKPKTGHLKSVGDEPEDLAKQEQGATENTSSLSPNEQSESSSLDGEEEDSPWDTDTKAPKGLRYKIRKKQAIAGSGIAGLIIGGGLGVATILGPVSQFLQFSALLERFHFSDNSSFGDNRAGKLIKWAKTRNKKQNRNLSAFGNKIADHYEKKIKAKGMTPDYDASTGRIKKIFIDDIDSPEGRKALTNMQTAGFDPEITDGSKSAVIDLEGKSARIRRRAISAMAGALDINGVSTSVASRMLKVRAGVDFHPLKNIARAADEDFWDYVNKRKAERDKARGSPDEPEKIKNNRKDNPDEPAPAGDVDADKKLAGKAGEIQDIASDSNIDHKAKVGKIKGTLNTALGLAGTVAIICGLDALGEEVGNLQEANIVGPLMRTGMDVITVSSQIKSGQGVNMDELGAISQEFWNKEEKTSWMSAESIQTELGRPNTGKSMPDSAKPGKEKPAFFKVIDNITDPISGVCNALNSTVGGIASTVVDFGMAAAAGPGSLVVAGISEAFQRIVAGAFMDDLVRILAGKGVDLANASGADFGNYANYGAFLSANNVARGMGGRALSDAERLALYNERQDIIKQQNKNKSLYARLVDPKDIDSLFSKTVVQNTNFSAPQTALVAAANIPLSSFNNLGSMFSKLSPSAKASGALYDYGVDKVGFSLEESDAIENPYDNAKKIEPKLKRYNKDYGEKCLGTTIDPDTYKIKYTAAPSYVDLEDNKKTCSNANSIAKYAGYRMYVADKVTATSIMCYEGLDEESCEEIGLKNTGSMQPEKAPAKEAGSQVVGNPYESSVDVACAEGTIDLGIHTGYTSGTPVQHKLCAVTNLPSSSSESTPGSTYYIQGADGKAIINSRLSGALYAMINDAKAAGVTLTAASSFRTMAHQQSLFKGDTRSVASPGSSPHQAATAIDFTKMGSKGGSSSDCSDRKRADGNPGWDWLFKNAEKYGFKQYSYEPWHWDPGPPGTNNRCDSSQP